MLVSKNANAVDWVSFWLGPVMAYLMMAMPGIAGAEPLTLELQPGQDSSKQIAQYFQVLRVEQSLSLEQVSKRTEDFTPLQQHEVNFGFTDDEIWIKVPVQNIGEQAAQWYLWSGARSRRLMAVYELDENATAAEIAGTEPSFLHRHSDRFDQRDIPHRYLVSRIQLQAGQKKILYIQLQSVFTTRIEFQFLSEQSFVQQQIREHLVLGLFLAAMLTLVLINLFQYVAVQKAVYGYYSLMAILSMLSATQHEGFNFRYLWPNSPQWDTTVTGVLGVLTSLATIQVFRAAIGLKRLVPAWDRALQVFMIVWAVWLPAMFVFDFQTVIALAAGLAIPLSFLILLLLVLVALKHRVESAGFYLAGWFFYFLGTGLFLSVNLGFNPLGIDRSVGVLQVGVLLEALILSMALAHQVRRLRQRHDHTRSNYIQLLEDRVADMQMLHRVEQEKVKALQEKNKKFLDLASSHHDVYQPLYAMRATLATVKDELSDGDALAEVDAAIDYAEAILKDSIKTSRSEVADSPSLIQLGRVFNDLFAQNFRLAQQKRLKLKFVPTTLCIQGSRVLLQRILDNLIKNAIRYTDQGKVLCGVRRRPQALDIQVMDTGPGIRKEDIERLMRPFQRNEMLDVDDQNFGLGLSIIRTLCEQQGFEFFIDSRWGQGTCFTVRIPTF